jgi:HlyD family secretion protein
VRERTRTAVFTGLAFGCAAFGLASAMGPVVAQDGARAARVEGQEEKHWQAVAPGRVESISGEIKVGASIVAPITDALVKAGDKVLPGEPLVRLSDNEAQARIANAQAQVAMGKRARDDQAPSSKAADRRRAEDAVADDKRSLAEAQAAFDRAVVESRAGRGSAAELDAARAALSRVRERLSQHEAELRKVEADTTVPLPTQAEGQLNLARAELWAAQAAAEKLVVRAPIAGTVLQVNAKPGELAAPSASQPLVLLGDISALRVRAEVDERDFGEIKLGQPVSVRPSAFRGREVAGKVSFIAPLVEPARNNPRLQRNQTDVDIVEVLVDLAEPGPLAVGMKADVYFRPEAAQR